MTKKYRHKDGRKTEREPTERERKADLYPGYEELTGLSRGIMEKESEEEEKAEIFSKRWIDFARANDLEDKTDNLLDLNDDFAERMRDRMRSISKEDPEFPLKLSVLLAPLVDQSAAVDAPVMTERKSKKKHSVDTVCNRAGFYSFNYFLQQLDVINRSQAGKLNQNK